jgi:hypothetical protein
MHIVYGLLAAAVLASPLAVLPAMHSEVVPHRVVHVQAPARPQPTGAALGGPGR